jgi:predicted phage terminase large subunit-like protein
MNPDADLFGLARLDLAAFCMAMRADFELPPFLEQIVASLEAVERRKVRRLLVSCPPRHGKSLTGSVLFPCWYLGRHPKEFVVVACHSEELAITFGRAVRNIVASPLFRAIFPECRLAGDSAAVNRFNLEAGGGFFAVGRGSALTGRGCSLLVLDDLVKDRAEADSITVRKSVEAWYREVALTRLEPRGAIIAIGTRWHEADILGTLAGETSEPWQVLSLPAIAEKDESFRREGEALWPERFSAADLARIRTEIGSRAWAALYQGRPSPEQGAIFRREWWQHYTTPPTEFLRIALSADCAFKGTATADYSAVTIWGEAKNGFFLLLAVRGRWEFPELKRRIVSLAEQWKPNAVLIEDAASGQSAIQELRDTSLPIIPVRPLGGKIERANAVTPIIEAGRVFVPESAGWLEDFMDEISSFPSSPHDDFVDTVSQALSYLRGRGRGFDLAGYAKLLQDESAGIPARGGEGST